MGRYLNRFAARPIKTSHYLGKIRTTRHFTLRKLEHCGQREWATSTAYLAMTLRVACSGFGSALMLTTTNWSANNRLEQRVAASVGSGGSNDWDKLPSLNVTT